MATNKTEELDLVDYAKEAADLRLAAHPGVLFTSGRRHIAAQVSAMAPNRTMNLLRAYFVDSS